MYPSYKEYALQSLVNEFARLVSYQTDKVVFDEIGLAPLNSRFVSPIHVSTRTVINIARLLKEMPESAIWNRADVGKVCELAAAAEQRESDDPDHLMHTLMYLANVCKDGNFGQLLADINSWGAITVLLVEPVTEEPVIEWLGKHIVTEGTVSTEYKMLSVSYSGKDDDWKLSFKARRLSDDKEVELPDDTLSPALKKEIADYIIDKASRNEDYSTPLQNLGNDYWIAPCHGAVAIDGHTVPTAINTIEDMNIITVEAGTTGPQGGDSGHGCRTYLRITNEASTDMSVSTGVGDVDSDGKYSHKKTDCGQVDQIEIMLGGDAELRTFTSALRFAADVLEKQAVGKLHIVVPK